MRGSSGNLRVLLFDDELDFSEMAAEFLQRQDDRLDVTTATIASEALNRLAGNTNDSLWKFIADSNELLFSNSPREEIQGRSVEALRDEPQSLLKGNRPEERAAAEDGRGRFSAGESVNREYRVNADGDHGEWGWDQGNPVIVDDVPDRRKADRPRLVTDGGEPIDVDTGVDSDLVPKSTTGPDNSPDGESVREAVLSSVRSHLDQRDRSDTGGLGPPSEAFIANEFFDFSYLDDAQEVERYWVNEPYAYVTVLYDATANSNRYHVVEPKLDPFEEYVREDLIRALRTDLMFREIEGEFERAEVFDREVNRVMQEQAATVPDGLLWKLRYYLRRDFVGYGKIDPIMRDRYVEDISCDGSGRAVFVYHNSYRDLRTNLSFDEKRLNAFVMRLAQRAGKHLSVADPLVDASLPDGSRAQLTLGGEVTTFGSNFTVRKFAEVPFTPVDLIGWGTFSVEQMAFLWLAVENHASLLFAGGTGSGKTTSLNAASLFIPPGSKIVSIEDTPEITLPHENHIQSVTREAITAGGRGAIGMYDLLQTALHQRPEYLVVGEIRTESQVAHTFFQSIATGHTAFTTFHADSIRGLLSRFQNQPLNVPKQMIGNLDLISVQEQVLKEGKRVRRNSRLVEVVAADVSARDIFRRNPATDTIEQVNESDLLANIAAELGWADGRLERELARREAVLSYLLEENINDYDSVTKTIQGFIRDPEYILEEIRAGQLAPEEIPVGGDDD